MSRANSVPFNVFADETDKELEASLEEKTDYINFNSSKLVVYPKTGGVKRGSVSPSLRTLLLIIVLSSVFIVPPIVYLLNCFDVAYNQSYYGYSEIKYREVKAHRSELNHKNHSSRDNHIKPQATPKVLPPAPKPDYQKCGILRDEEKFDCYPENGANKQSCEARGCCWSGQSVEIRPQVPLNVPYCFYPPNFNTYNFINVTDTKSGLVAFMRRSFRTGYPADVELLKMVVKYETENRLHVKILDATASRFEPLYPEVPLVNTAAVNKSYIFEMDLLQSGFKVVRRDDNTTIFDANNFLNLIFSKQFLQISSKLPSKYIYGIGEHQSNLLLSTEWSQFTLFNHDAIPSFNKNLYGSHPFYLMMENSVNSHGVFLLNSNAMDVILQPTPAITFRTIGGVLDFYFFMGPSPADVVSQYTDLIGHPFMPPYWGLGFHLCRFGYKTLNDTKAIMQSNIDAGIPLDTQWNDLDYMNNSNDFTIDAVNYKGLSDFIDDLHSRGMHYIPLIDPGVSASEVPGSYLPYDVGIKMDIFVKNSTGQPFIGKVWNKHSTVWPDFTDPNGVTYWTLMLKKLHDQVKFDGVWIDMNEPSNFLSGSFNGCPQSSLENPPYLPGVDGGIINYKTMCMSARHYAGLHYDIHNVYGLAEAIATSFAMEEIRGKRPMVISRSSFSGLGHFVGHWSGDVWSAWSDMRYSIPGMLSFSLFGVPLMGADICGFNGNTTEALCNRWMQLGAFYPFSRNHNTDDGIPQDPVSMGEQVVTSSRRALLIRYSFLPYLYTLFHKAHVAGETVARPLFFEFLDDPATYSIDTQFLWGPALMIIPVLEEAVDSVQAYVPKGVWYDFYTKWPTTSEGENFTLSAPLDTIPLLIRGGYILPQQNPNQTTTESRKSKIELFVACDQEGKAFGELFWDDGDSLNTYELGQYYLTSFEVADNVLRSLNLHESPLAVPPNLASLFVLGIDKFVSKVTVNGSPHTHFTFDEKFKYLLVEDLDLNLQEEFIVTWQ
ncbi:lysosomal alpha-glucosidase [Leptinotarsa decemlineata]|uniref:lysosomal alpha-glucosidase n=1 Tax=Leptinotarsa decemlineata TaxID=7539 RepID=UPI003D304284